MPKKQQSLQRDRGATIMSIKYNLLSKRHSWNHVSKLHHKNTKDRLLYIYAQDELSYLLGSSRVLAFMIRALEIWTFKCLNDVHNTSNILMHETILRQTIQKLMRIWLFVITVIAKKKCNPERALLLFGVGKKISQFSRKCCLRLPSQTGYGFHRAVGTIKT